MIPGYLLAGAVGADRTAVGQTLLAHPAVAAPLCGWMVGAFGEGLWLGFLLSLISHEHLPLGHERLRDHASIAVALPLALGAGASLGQWGILTLVGVLWAKPLAALISLLREWGRQAQERARRTVDERGMPAIERWHFALAGLHFARGVLAVALSVFLFRLVLWGWRELAGPTEELAMARLFMVAPLLGVPGLARARRRALWVLPGLLIGLVLWWARGGGW